MYIIDVLLSLSTLIILEIVLGIDNLVFLAILSEKLPKEQRKKARHWGLTFAWVTRLILLGSAVYLSKLTRPLFSLSSMTFSVRDLFLFGGGLFLITKATQEIHNEINGNPVKDTKPSKKLTLRKTVIQIAIMDIIFSLDSVLTAIGLTDNFWIMAVAITCAILVMIFASEPVSVFIDKHPTLKMLALSFLILIGVMLLADGLGRHIPRAYIYFSMGFSIAVEILNLRRHAKRKAEGNKP